MEVKSKFILKHIGAWSILLFIPHLFLGFSIDIRFTILEIIVLFPVILIFYVHAGLLVPRYYIKRKYLYYFLSIIGLAILFQIVSQLVEPLHFHIREILDELDFRPKHIPADAPHPILIHRWIGFFITLAASGMYSYSIENAKREKKLHEMEKQQIQSNLQLLKSQIRPHFLFNALNSIYSLSLKKSDDLPKAILTISDMLRYVTYDGEENKVKVAAEIKYMKDYANVQKLRLSPDSIVNFDVQNENETVEIAPMLLIPFVENAFKHGTDEEGKVEIYVSVHVTNEAIDFSIVNKKSVGNQKDTSHGIGIQNVKSRLEILYCDKYSLDCNETENQYKVLLKIKL